MDGTETKQDAKQTSPSAAPSAAKQETPATPKTFTESDVQKAVNDALAKAGREAKSIETARTEIAKREADIRKAEQDRELAELESVKDKPEELSIIQRKQKLAADIRAHNAEAEKKQQEWAAHEVELAELKATKYEMSVFAVAEKNGVSADLLKAKATELGITDTAGVEKLAAIMPKKMAPPTTDSGKTMGGGTTPEKARDKISAGFAELHK